MTITCSCGIIRKGECLSGPCQDCLTHCYSEELSSFTDQPDVITSVALVRPKAGVFIDEITWLLVICTPISVLLLGISSTPLAAPNRRTRQDIKLYATDMSLPTEVEMTSVIGTSDGRIFMAGAQDGNLYELHYQEKEGWFEKRVQLLNHSVGGVQSFLPILNASKSSGRSCTYGCILAAADLL